ncbi:MAG: endonuclease/exonuclease/phosphatase family protein [Deltaproteobacteria bacterium]|nr:endonuclease/exonuclease/phosphatase family protein [Deltaproteobacteria bacterium]
MNRLTIAVLFAALLVLAGCGARDHSEGSNSDDNVPDDDTSDDDAGNDDDAGDDDTWPTLPDDDATDDDADDDTGDDDDFTPYEYSVMTFNLRTGLAFDGLDSWPFRRSIVRDFIASEMPDVMGVQEGWRFQLNEIASYLTEYAWVGRSREGFIPDEYSAVFYRADRFDALADGTFWLSDTPDEPRSVFSDAQGFPRIVTWAHLRERATGFEFFAFNTHLDTTHADEVHERSAALIVQRIDDIADGAPVVLTGDFNDPVGAASYDILTGSLEYDGAMGNMLDPWISLGLPEEGSFHGFTGVPTGPSRIDWVLHSASFTPTTGEVSHYHEDGRYPSDHFPVMTTLSAGRTAR